MKKEFLLQLGVDEETAAKIMDENGNDIQHVERKLAAAITERDDWKEQYDDISGKLKAFEGVDVGELQGKITTLTNDLAQKEKDYNSKIAKMERQRETEAFFNGLEQKFINDETREYYLNKVDALLDDDKSKGKSRQELLDSLTKDEKGELRPNIFNTADSNPNKLGFGLPPAGNANPFAGLTKDAFLKMPYEQRVQLKQEHPQIYETVK